VPFAHAEATIADKVNVTFAMTASDLYFLRWAMTVLEGGPHYYEEECKEWGCRFNRVFKDNFEEIPRDEMQRTVSYGDHGTVTIGCSDESDWRLPRLERVLGYATTLAEGYAGGNILANVASLHDLGGTLRMRWKVKPAEKEKGYFQKAWEIASGDCGDAVEHEIG
jgi:hypothetical protein